ncbi:hypothetical protein GCM10011607_11840 [Shewanella inventionis]|uniref:Uncharacterized protein n=1 Tax=Shewanella inventionis TaxID=1738770 RepID=A0ABQ1IUN5_9GAMM|nr:hypothetical protein [Shewanella inventionis]GGB52973.1 hypothetical protein GCM10011607_11840 [Shewanella inventionis]
MSSDIVKNFCVNALPRELTSSYSDKDLYVIFCRARGANDYLVRWNTKVEWIGPKDELHHYCSVMAEQFDDGLYQSDGIEFESNGASFTSHIQSLINKATPLTDKTILDYKLQSLSISESIYLIAFPIAKRLLFKRHPNPTRNEFVTLANTIDELTELFSLCHVASVVNDDPVHCWYYRPNIVS